MLLVLLVLLVKMPRRPFACVALCRKGVHAQAPRGNFLAAASTKLCGTVAVPALQPCSEGIYTLGTPAGNSHHKATAMAQGISPAAAMASFRRFFFPPIAFFCQVIVLL